MIIHRYPQYVLLAGCILLLAACATTTNVDYRQGYNFSAIRNLSVTAPDGAETSDPRISGPLVGARVSTAIERTLGARGFRVTAQGADARLAWRLATRGGVESNNSGISFGYGTFSRHTGVGIGYGFPFRDVDSYDEAVLTIDILEPAGDGLLWRGSAYRRLYDGMTPEKLDELINGLVDEVLGQFPPGGHG